jgi:hypothetical protein
LVGGIGVGAVFGNIDCISAPSHRLWVGPQADMRDAAGPGENSSDLIVNSKK